MTPEVEAIKEKLSELRPLIARVTDPVEAQYVARNLEQQVKILTRKFRTGNPLSNLLAEKDLRSPAIRN
mgnify:CR=1 FL=1